MMEALGAEEQKKNVNIPRKLKRMFKNLANVSNNKSNFCKRLYSPAKLLQSFQTFLKYFRTCWVSACYED